MTRSSRGGRGLRSLGWIVLALATACGEEPAQPSGRSMTAPAEASAARVNRAPEITRVVLDPRRPQPGQDVSARVEAHDADGDPVRLRYAWRLDGRVQPARTARLRVPESARKGQRLELEVVPSDGVAEGEAVVVRSEVGNRPPALFHVTLVPADGVRRGEEVVAVVDARDADDDPLRLRYEWLVDGEVVGREERLRTDDLRRGDRITVRVVASDGEAETAPMESHSIPVANSAPRITSTPGAVAGDGVFRYAVEASDPDGDRRLRFRLAEAPAGATIDPILGELVWHATREQVGTHPLEVVVEDGHGGEARQRFEVTVREVVEQAAAEPQPPAAAE